MSELHVLDVGHGNAAVVISDPWVAVIDTGRGSALLEFLRQSGIDKVELVLISHADQDHIAGITGLLSARTVAVRRVFLNADSSKESAEWDDLVYELDQLQRGSTIEFEVGLTEGRAFESPRGVRLDVLAPSKYIAAKGAGSVDRADRQLTSNSMSAVVALSAAGNPVAVLAGDLDVVGFENLKANVASPGAPILVFPHHGGGVGGDLAKFARDMCDFFHPGVVVFSLGRGRFGTPRPEVIDAIRDYGAGVRIACTQLSENCAATLPPNEPSHLLPSFAQGKPNRCCAGSMRIRLDDASLYPEPAAHIQFIRENAPTALCDVGGPGPR